MSGSTRAASGASGRATRTLQFLRFACVGGSGVLVNLAATALLHQLLPPYDTVALPLPGTRFNVRWYHVIATAAFVVANVWNYELNRRWTFKGHRTGHWWRGLAQFMGIGLVALGVGLAIQSVLLNQGSPLFLGRMGWLDDRHPWTNRLYWATIIQIGLTIPVNFVANRLLTFRVAKHVPPGDIEELPLLAPIVDPDLEERAEEHPQG